MRETKYLLRKKSGSRNHYKRNWLDYERADYKGDFADDSVEEKFPKTEGMTTKDKNGIDATLVNKWLYSQVGKNFDDVYSEFLDRVQPKYLETHKDCIYWYVEKANEVKIIDGVVYKKLTGRFYGDKTRKQIESEEGFFIELKGGFYVHPETNILSRVIEPKKRTMSRKEGKTKHAKYKTDRNKSYNHHKETMQKIGDKAVQVMKEKKAKSKKDESEF